MCRGRPDRAGSGAGPRRWRWQVSARETGRTHARCADRCPVSWGLADACACRRSIMRWRNRLTFAGEEVMIRLLLKNEADCLIRQHKPRDRLDLHLQRRIVAPTARAV